MHVQALERRMCRHRMYLHAHNHSTRSTCLDINLFHMIVVVLLRGIINHRALHYIIFSVLFARLLRPDNMIASIPF